MDQLRVALDWLKRYHFWVLSVFVALIAVACWAKASSKMVATFKANESTIKGQFKSVQDISGEPFHPNENVNTKQAEETKKQSDAVAELWKKVYAIQRERALKWPVPPLSKEFGDT